MIKSPTVGPRQLVKDLSKELLSKLKADKLVIDWRKKARRKAGVRACIQDVLDALPDTYSDDLYDKKCGQVFEHVYESYWGDGQSKYAVA